MLGEFQRPAEPRTHQIADAFRMANINCKVTDDLARAHWEKLVWNIPFNGLGVAGLAGIEAFTTARALLHIATDQHSCLTTDRLLGDSQWEELVRNLMLEVIAIANALGYDLSESLAEKQIERTRTMGAYKASTLIDFEQGRPLELESLFLEPLRQARAAGQRIPKLERLCEVLAMLAARKEGV
jgi:2-dehydropantoate 2-reductase